MLHTLQIFIKLEPAHETRVKSKKKKKFEKKISIPKKKDESFEDFKYIYI